MLLIGSYTKDRRFINLSGIWIDRVHDRKTPKMIVLDMDSPKVTVWVISD
jgi:hypothetical protein